MFDGEGVGDDRRLNLLLKQFCVWSNQLDRDDVPQSEKDLNFERMLMVLNEAEVAMKKSEAIKTMCAAELKAYDQVFGTIEEDIEKSKLQLLNLKVFLLILVIVIC